MKMATKNVVLWELFKASEMVNIGVFLIALDCGLL